jgi:hypothetical protein
MHPEGILREIVKTRYDFHIVAVDHRFRARRCRSKRFESRSPSERPMPDRNV